MPDTTRWGLTYQGLYDPPDGAALGETLAVDVDGALGRALPVTNAAARSALGATLTVADRGLMVLQDDTDTWYGWTGAVWAGPFATSGGGGGGGGGVGARGRWAASTAQTIPNDADANVAFGSVLADPGVDIVRAVDGAGHKFTLGRAGTLSGSLTLRYASTSADGVRDVHVIADGTNYLGSSGGAVKGQPCTHSVAIGPVDLASGAAIRVQCYQGTGAARQLEPATAGRWVQLALELR